MTEDMSKRQLIEAKWRSIDIDSKSFLFKFVKDEEASSSSTYEMLLYDSDEFELFHLKHQDQDIQRLFKKLNPSMEAPSSKIVATLESNLLNSRASGEHFTLEPRKEKDRLTIRMESKLAGVKIVWQMSLRLLEAKHIRDYVLMPLVFTCAEYQNRERDLLKTILAKDKEIDDYTSQGCKLSRQFLATKPFSVDSFDKEVSSSGGDELIKNPMGSLSTTYADKLNRICFDKYIKSYYKLDEVVSSPAAALVKTDKSESSQSEQSAIINSQEPDRSQRVSQRDERLKQLEQIKDEPKKATPKKKKLF